MKDKNIEGKVAETILQEPDKIKIGNKTYEVRPASVATLIQVSRLISRLPDVKLDIENNADILVGSLMIANKCEILGEIAATLVLGARKPSNTPQWVKNLLQLLKIGFKSKHEKLGEKILYEFGSKDLNSMVVRQLSKLEIGDFFGLTTSLLDVNILRRTKGVV
jgi:hypothetical protein